MKQKDTEGGTGGTDPLARMLEIAVKNTEPGPLRTWLRALLRGDDAAKEVGQE